ncbi:MAG TPA: PilZ domain-containing protein [Pyrinomonadaceae bacterium]|jgi:hypothetical protein
MSDELEENESGPSQRPRSPRVPVDFAVEIEGRNPQGEQFRAQAKAVKVSRGGATLLTDAPLTIGAQVRVTPPYGRTLEAEVNGVWTEEEDGQQRVGVKLLDENGWFAE